jgi:nucleoside-diphosphate-sugar epimerase
MMLVLVTGATGKVGRRLIERCLGDDGLATARVRALCHNRVLEPAERLEVARGDISRREDVATAMRDVTHVVHLATCKETPDSVMDVTVKGLFWLLEEFRGSPTAKQFILIGGDAAVGHFFYKHPGPITEATSHQAYPGCYALSKVLEEVMLQQYVIQYGIDACCLRAPWIMEKDDFKYTLSFGDDVFGGPVWKNEVSAEAAKSYRQSGTVPVLLNAESQPLKRNFVHVDDLVSAILAAIDNPRARGELYNICMDEPVDYSEVASYLGATRGLPAVEVPSSFHSNWMDNAKAKLHLGWRPQYDLKRLIDSAWDYVRSAGEPRKVWYPG